MCCSKLPKQPVFRVVWFMSDRSWPKIRHAGHKNHQFSLKLLSPVENMRTS